MEGKFKSSSAAACFLSIRTLSTIAMAAILLLFFLIMTAVWTSAYSVNIAQFTANQKSNVFQLIVAKVEEALSSPMASIQMISDNVRSKKVDILSMTDCEPVTKLLWYYYLSLERNFKDLGFTSLYYGMLDGAVCGYTRDFVLGTFMIDSWPFVPKLKYIPIVHNSSSPNPVVNDGLLLVNQTIQFDYGPFYTVFVNTTRWTKSYPFHDNPTVWISAIVPFFDDNGRHYGFAGYDADIRFLSETLHDMVTIPGAFAFMIESDTWYLIGTSYQDKLPFALDEKGHAQMIRPEQFEVPVLANTAKYMSDQYGHDFSKLDRTQDTEFDFVDEQQTRYFVKVRRINVQGADIIIVLGVPQMYFLKEFVIAICAATAGSLLLLILAVSFTVVGITIFIAPIRSLISQFSFIEVMQLDQVKFGRSLFLEIQQLQQGLSHTISKLKEYRAFIPEHLLDQENQTQPEKPEDAAAKAAALTQSFKNNKVTPGNNYESDTHSNTRSSISSASGVRGLNHSMFTLGLNTKPMTILCIKTSSFKEMLVALSPSELVEAHGQIVQQIMNVVKRTGGQLVMFNKELITIAYNALKNQPDHMRLACQAALDITKSIANDKSGDIGKPKFEIHIAIATGTVLAGNVGNQVMKQYCVEGEANDMAHEMVKLCPKLGCKILVDDAVGLAAEKDYSLRGIDRVVFHDVNPRRTVSLSSLESSKRVNGDEWMYQMQEEANLKKYDTYKEGFELFVQGKYPEAASKFEASLAVVPNDTPSKRLQQVSSNNLQGKTTLTLICKTESFYSQSPSSFSNPIPAMLQ